MTMVLLCGALTSWAESEPYNGGSQEPVTIKESNYTDYGFTADDWQNFSGYYGIRNAKELYGFAALVNGGKNSINAVLTDDIVVNLNVPADGNLNGATMHSWTPIGTYSKNFKGTFDGNGHTISGLYFSNISNKNYPDGGKYVGLIGYANGAKIKNVGIVDSFLYGYQYVGGICGIGGTQTNCYNIGTVKCYSYSVGGICGGSGTQTNCHNTGMVSSLGSNGCVGGICGSNGTQTNCYNTGKVSGTGSYVGGICGSGGTQTNCYNTGKVSASNYVGGICGQNGTQINCYNTGTVSVSSNYVGGICGSGGTQTNCCYLAGCGSKNTLGVSATAEEFSNGKVTYLLNGGTSEGNLAWYQTIGTDALPVWDNTHGVVYATQPCPSFTNDPNGTHKAHSLIDATGYCTSCCQFLVQGTLVTESNYSDLNLTTDFVGYYAISDLAELYWFAYVVNNGNATINVVLTADIVVNENVLTAEGELNGTPTYSWIPAGTYSKNYKGTFDGNSHTISGLYFNNRNNNTYPNGGNYVGLIGYANGAKIKNVGVIDSYINANNYVGGICGYCYNTSTTINNCYNTGTVSGGTNYVSGICGYNGTQTNCYNTGKVLGYNNVGGICGYFGTIIDCHNTGAVTGLGSNGYVGGICGQYGTQTNCHNTGEIKARSNYVGGICGNGGTQTNCYNTGTIKGSGNTSFYIGGICGSDGTQTNCHNTGGVSGSNNSYYAGGICGSGGKQTNCYNTGGVWVGSNYVGGICGQNGTQTNCYNTGTVSAYYSNVGGICGDGGTHTNCYYLVGCGSKNSLGVYTTAEEFASGKIGYLLNGNNNNAWYQNLYSDGYPLLDNTHNPASGYIEEDGDTYTVVGDMFLATNYEIAEGKTLIVPVGATLTTTGEAVITNNGTLRANGTLSGNNLAGNGTFVTELISLCSISNLNESYVYKSTDYTVEDGLTNVAVSTEILGKTFILDANVTVSYSENHNVGTATISWTNNADENDVLSGQFEITPKTLAISNIKAENKVYDGNTTTTVSYTADVFSGDNVTFGTAATFDDKTARTGKTVSFNYTKSGADANNYAFAKTSETTTANIEQRELVISKTEAAGKVYDGNPATTVTIEASNIVEGDKVEFGKEAAFEDKNVGTNKDVNFEFSKSGADAANYKFAATTGTTKAAITARELTLSNFTASDKVYDGTTDATGSFTDNRVSGDKLEFSYDIAFANANVVEDGNSVNFSNIAISGGADKNNYSLVTLSGSAAADITPVTDEVVVTVTLADKTVTYNGAEQTYSASAARTVFAANNALYNVEENVAESDNAQSISGTNADNYPFGWTAGMFSNTSTNFSNVTFNVTDGKLIITPKTGVVVTITENSGELVYNTEEQSVEGYTYSIDDELGIYSEDDFSFSGTAAVAGTTVGTYPMELSAADFSNLNTNYADVEFVIVDGALKITKAPEAPNKPAATMETRHIVTQLVALPENWKWADEQQALAEGDNTATANYDGADKGNYIIESVDITVIRLGCEHPEGVDILNALEPTCTTEGYTGDQRCKICGKIIATGETIPAAGHKADSVVFENIVAATCTIAGSYDSVVYCSVCHIELSRDAIVIPAAGHKADSVAFENIVEATRTAAGSYDSVVYCSVCKIELSRTTIDVPQILAQTIKLASKPNKVEYKQGEALDVKGGKITIGYSDKSTEDFEILAGWVSGFDSQKVGEQKLTVTFESVSSTLTTTFNVTVSKEDDNTAIADEAAEISIYAYNSTIVVEAADALTGEIAVFDVNGRMVVKTLAAGSRTEIAMPRQGLYIVRFGNQAKRVMVY